MKDYVVTFYAVGDKVWYRAPKPAAAGANAVVVDIVIGHPAVTYLVELQDSGDRVWAGATQLAPR
jgi:hypothetical protein